MAGTTEETEAALLEQEPVTGNGVADSSNNDSGADVDAFAARGFVDDSVRMLTLSGLNGRLHTVQTWKSQGNVKGDPLLIVADTVHAWLEEKAPEIEAARIRANNPQPPAKEPCDKCAGVDTHKPACPYLAR